MAVQRHDCQLVGIRCELDARDIGVCFDLQVHLARYMAFDVVCVYAYFRVVCSGFRVFIVVAARISGVRFLFRSQSLVPLERIHGHFAFIEADIGDHLAVCAEVKCAVKRELLFIYPVGNAVDDFIVFSVFCDLRFAVSEQQLDQIDVVVPYKGNLMAVGRKERNLLRAVVGERFQRAVLHVVDVIDRSERTAVDRLGFCLD